METLTNTLETIAKGKWQWKSNLDPWSKSEEPQWESYSLDHNYLIEKAYYDQQKEVDLGDYLVYPLEMLQRKKGNPQAQRPIRRIDWMEHEEMNDRSSRYFETELPKTLNKIFGSLEDFLSFFGRRNREILEFQKEFEVFEESKDTDILKNKIIPLLVSCLENELLNPISKQLQDPSLSKLKKKALLSTKERNENLILLFHKDFSSVEEFYGQILKSYTMNTSLYANLNKYLRNESWVEIDNLLPYIFCLCKAFFNIKPNSSSKENSILLYRGTALDEASLMSYYMKKNERYFSWYSVTSTTRNAKIAQEFMFRSVNLKEKKTPVMFIIEIPIPADDLKWIDIQQYSAIPTEDEVILAPGSVFEIEEIVPDKLSTTIKLKLKGEVQSLAHGGMMMQGALQSQMMTEKQARIMCLEGEELDQALMSLCENKLIEELEFCLCTFDKKRLKKMFEILAKVERATRLKFIACVCEDNGEVTMKGEICGVTRIEVIEANEFFQKICNERLNQEYWVSLVELDIDFSSKRSITDEELNCAVSQGFKCLSQLTSLRLNFEECRQITDDGVKILAQKIESLSKLTHLDVNFSGCQQITNKGMNSFTKSLSSLTQMRELNLNFNGSQDIRVDNLAKSLHSLTQLMHFSLCFKWWKQDSSLRKLLSSLTQLTHLNLNFTLSEEVNKEQIKGLESLTELTHLNLNFTHCKEIAQEEMNCLAKELNSLGRLTHLNISFERCEQITDESLSNFAQAFDSLTRLTCLDLNFKDCDLITNEGVNSLAQGINYLVQLTHLNLDFRRCDEITDEGVISLALRINSLVELTHLHLNFENCEHITNEGVSFLMSEGLRNLTQLTSLVLDFDYCEQITGQELEILAEKWLSLKSPLVVNNQRLQNIDTLPKERYSGEFRVVLAREKSFYGEVLPLQMAPIESEFSDEDIIETLVSIFEENEDEIDSTVLSEVIPGGFQLTSLTMNFKAFQDSITDDFVRKLSSQVLGNLLQLSSLTLNFYGCKQITDKGLSDLALYGLQPLKNLASLKLDFTQCDQITDVGVIGLASEGLQHLSQLKSLALCFFWCFEVSDEGVIGLASHGLRHLSQLETFSLTPSTLTDKGVDGFVTQGLQYLVQLKFLSINFAGGEITDKGVNNLVLRIVKNLKKLTFLDLNLDDCGDISDSTVQNIIKVLRYFGFTKEVETETLIDWGYMKEPGLGLGDLGDLGDLSKYSF